MISWLISLAFLKGEKSGMTWRVQAEMEYSTPCDGCSNCYSQRIDLQPMDSQKRSWWSSFGKRQSGKNAKKNVLVM